MCSIPDDVTVAICEIDTGLLGDYNVITIKTTIISIGNSKGVRLPKILLEESGITKDVEVKVVRGSLRITPVASGKTVDDTALLSQKSLAKDWSKPEEDKAWANL